MKILVEISDDQIIAALRETIRDAMKAAAPKSAPLNPHEMANLMSALNYADAANHVIEYLGGEPEDVTGGAI